MAVRNPLSAFLMTIVGALVLTFFTAIPVLFFPYFAPYFDLQLLYLAFVAVAVGAVSGRSSLLGSMGLVGAFVGAFFGDLLFQFLLFPTGWELLLALAYGGAAGLGGFLTGKLGLRRAEKAAESLPKTRRCQRCGARVGITARKCWSCRASLPPT